jgi:serine/threonine protein kinase
MENPEPRAAAVPPISSAAAGGQSPRPPVGSGSRGHTLHGQTQHQVPATIGVYPVERELGRGGMGVVYLARDPRLGRQVAIKVLPSAFAADPIRMTRFEREARTLASMNHRNVAMIYGLDQSPEGILLVLEYVPGITLSSRLARGALPVEEVLRVGIQIAEGLEVAHELSIVHRDLKPDNVRITPEGLVKVLDFGLATSASTGGLATANTIGSETSTAGSGLTVQGMVMGTPGYMSPEQARGLGTDRRTDVFAFGCVLYEMLSGAKAFWGETVTDALAAVLDREPDFSLIPQRCPTRLRELVRKCLIKDQRRRLRDVGDARNELEDILAQPQSGWYKSADAQQGARPRVVARLSMPLALPAQPGGLVSSASDAALANAPGGAIAVSPDGAVAALVIVIGAGSQLALRRLDSVALRLIPGTLGASGPTFSPDGSKLAFFQAGKLCTISLAGGVPVPLADAPRPGGASWADDGSIYFIPDWQAPLCRVGVTGGSPETIAAPVRGSGEHAMLMPDVLPGSRCALVTIWTGKGFDDTVIAAVDLRTGQRRPLIHHGSNPHSLPSGHLMFSRGSDLLAVAFDPDKLEVFGDPIVVETGLLAHAPSGSAQFAAGADGTLLYASGGLWEPSAELVITDREGSARPVGLDKRPFARPIVSPDGSRLLVEIEGATHQLWKVDLLAGAPAGPLTRLTHQADNRAACFTPDGKRIVLRSSVSGAPGLASLRLDISSAPIQPLIGFPGRIPTPCCVTSAGLLIFTLTRAAPESGLELWSIELGNPSSPSPASARQLFSSVANLWGADVSPDGRLLAFVSDESGRPEVFVQPMPLPDGTCTFGGPAAAMRRQVSTDGGVCPTWSSTGGELYFRVGNELLSVRVAVEPTILIGRTRPVAKLPPGIQEASRDSREFALMRDTLSTISVMPDTNRSRTSTLEVALNWFEELRKRAPVPERFTPVPAAPSSRAMLTSQGGSGGPAASPAPARPNATPAFMTMPTRFGVDAPATPPTPTPTPAPTPTQPR